MLKLFRKNIKVIIWVIVLAFVAWGAGTLTISKGSDSLYVGAIGNEKISQLGQELESLGLPVLFLGSLFERTEVNDYGTR